MVDMSSIIAVIQRTRVDLSDEKRAQAEIAAAFGAAGISAAREVRLGAGDIIDFLAQGVGIEIKLRSSSRREILRQLRRYALHPEVRELVLASNIAIALPREIEGKPVGFASLGRAWL